jgi:hypothetical protein
VRPNTLLLCTHCCGVLQVNDDCSFSATPAGYATADGGDVVCGSDPITGTAEVHVDEEGSLTSFSECTGAVASSAMGACTKTAALNLQYPPTPVTCTQPMLHLDREGAMFTSQLSWPVLLQALNQPIQQEQCQQGCMTRTLLQYAESLCISLPLILCRPEPCGGAVAQWRHLPAVL